MRALADESWEDQYDKERLANADRMEAQACHILSEYTKESQELAYHALLHTVDDMGDRTCLDLARSGRCIKFAAQPAFDSLIDRFWYGRITGPANRDQLIRYYPLTVGWLKVADINKYFEQIVYRCLLCYLFDFLLIIC